MKFLFKHLTGPMGHVVAGLGDLPHLFHILRPHAVNDELTHRPLPRPSAPSAAPQPRPAADKGATLYRRKSRGLLGILLQSKQPRQGPWARALDPKRARLWRAPRVTPAIFCLGAGPRLPQKPWERIPVFPESK